MKKMVKKFSFLLFFLTVVLLSFVFGTLIIPEADKIKVNENPTSSTEERMDILRLSAIGDSLTEGVGDTTHTGGYVPLLQADLSEDYPIDVVQADNYGKAGDRSDQVLKRLKKDEEMQESVKKADVILLTAGGNDLMKVITSKIFNKIDLKDLVKPRKNYQKELDKLYTEIRTLNPDAPIYQLGIYNPFYKTFSEIEEMQDIMDYWNEGSKEFVEQQDNAYFVPINDEIYNGLPEISLEDEDTETTTSGDQTTSGNIINDLISEEDSFHPNNLGYQIIANAFQAKMASSKAEWLK